MRASSARRVARLEVLVTTLPAGASAQALAATRGAGVVAQLADLARLRSAGAPDRVVRDLVDLVEAYGIAPGELEALVAAVATARRVQAAAAIGGFADEHGLDWSRADRRQFLAVLRDLPRTEVARWRGLAATRADARAAMLAAAGAATGLPPVAPPAVRHRAWFGAGVVLAGAAAGAGGLALAGASLGAPILAPATIGAVLIMAAVRAPRSANPARGPPAAGRLLTAALTVSTVLTAGAGTALVAGLPTAVVMTAGALVGVLVRTGAGWPGLRPGRLVVATAVAAGAALLGLPGAAAAAVGVGGFAVAAGVVATLHLLRVGPRGVAELTVAGATTVLAVLAGTVLAAWTVPATVAATAALALASTAVLAGLRRLNGGRIQALETRTLRTAVPLALVTGALLAGAPIAALAVVAGVFTGRALPTVRNLGPGSFAARAGIVTALALALTLLLPGTAAAAPLDPAVLLPALDPAGPWLATGIAGAVAAWAWMRAHRGTDLLPAFDDRRIAIVDRIARAGGIVAVAVTAAVAGVPIASLVAGGIVAVATAQRLADRGPLLRRTVTAGAAVVAGAAIAVNPVATLAAAGTWALWRQFGPGRGLRPLLRWTGGIATAGAATVAVAPWTGPLGALIGAPAPVAAGLVAVGAVTVGTIVRAVWRRLARGPPPRERITTAVTAVRTAIHRRLLQWVVETEVSRAAERFAAATDADRDAAGADLVHALVRADDAGSRPGWVAGLAGWDPVTMGLTVAAARRRVELDVARPGWGDADRQAAAAAEAVLDDELGARTGAGLPVAAADAVRGALAAAQAVLDGSGTGFATAAAGADALGLAVRWTVDGPVAVLPDGTTVPVPVVELRALVVALTDQARQDAGAATMSAVGFWAGQVAAHRGQDRTAGILDALSALADRVLALELAREVVGVTGGSDAVVRAELGRLPVAGVTAERTVAFLGTLGYVAPRSAELSVDARERAAAVVDAIDALLAGRLGAGDELAAVAGAVDEIVALLTADGAALQERVAVKRAAAAAADAAVDAALENAVVAGDQDDRGAAERTRKAFADGEAALANRRRLLRSESAYATAAAHADTAVTGFAVVRDILAAIAADPAAPGVAALITEAQAYAGEAVAAVEEYRGALVDTVPARTAVPTGFPIGELPAIAEVTGTVNQQLAELGSRHRMTELEISDLIRSRFDAVAGEGLLISAGGVELVIRLGVDWLVEDMTPGAAATEVMLGSIPQGGRSSSAGANRSGGVSLEADLAALAALSPSDSGMWGLLKSLAAHGWKATFSVNGGISEGTSGGGSGYVLTGGVADNRGDGIALRAGVTYRITARSRALPQGRTVTVRSSGGQDADVLHQWVSHTYSANAPPELAPARVRSGALPHHAPLTATGLNDLADAISAALGKAGRIGSLTRDQVRVMIANDLPGRLGVAVDGPHGLEWVLSDARGREIAVLRVRTTVGAGRIVGVASTKEHIEDLFVLFSGASGSLSGGRSFGLAGGVGLLVDTAAAWFGVTTGFGASWSRSRSTGVNASAVAIHPAVHRFSGHTVAEQLDLVHTAEIEWLDGRASPAPVVLPGTALVRMSEGDAHRFGLPVGADAVTGHRADGTPIMRDDLDPAVPAGRRGELPAWIGEAGIRGFGHGLVRELTGMGELLEQVEQALDGTGLLPGSGRVSRPELAMQWANRRELAEQLSAARLQGSYDQAAQQGYTFALARYRPGHAPQHVTIRVRVEPDWAGADYLGHSTAWTMVGLDIGSDTTGRSRSLSRTTGGNANVGGQAAIGGDTDLAKDGVQAPGGGSAGANGRGELGRSQGSAVGTTANQVTLVEGTSSTAVFALTHTVIVERLERGGRVTELGRIENATGRVHLPADLLPDAAPLSTIADQPVAPGVLRRMTVLAADFGGIAGVLSAAGAAAERARLPAAAHIEALISVDGLRAHLLEAILAGHGTSLAVRAQGGRTDRPSVLVRATPGGMRLVTVADLVLGDIHLALGSQNTSAGHSRKGAGGGSLSGAWHQLSAPKGNAGAEAGYARGSGTGSVRQQIWGRERLTIEVGRTYVFEIDLGIDVTAGRTGSTSGRAVVALPERDVLDLYLRGELQLPADQVVDVVERFRNGSLDLDEVLAARLLDHYRTAVRPAVQPHTTAAEIAARHTDDALTAQWNTAFGETTADLAGRIEAGLRRAAAPPVTVLPSYLHDGLGQTAIEQVTWRRGGADTQLFDEVVAAVEAAVPGALAHDPALRQTLFAAFAGKRWAGHIDAMLDGGDREASASSSTCGCPVPGSGPTGSNAWTCGSRAGSPPRAVHLGFARTVLQIIQDYGYGQRERSANTTRSTNAGLNGGAAGTEGSAKASLGTGHGLGSSARVAGTTTRLDGTATFTGADRVGHELSVTVTARAPRRGLEATRALTGDLVRLIPSGLIDSTPGAALPADAPFRMPGEFSVESTRTPTLLSTITRALRRFVGPAAVDELAAADLEHLLSPNARSAFLRRALAPGGHLLATLPVGLRRHVEIVVRASASGGRVLVGGRSLELRTVNRYEAVFGAGRSDSRTLPLSRGTGGAVDGTGLSGGVSSGSSASHGIGVSGGRRTENTLYRAGVGATVEIGLRFEIELTLVRTSRAGVDRAVRSITVQDTGTGFVTLFESDLERALPGVLIGPPRPAAATSTVSAGTISGGVGGPIAVGGFSAREQALVQGALARMWRFQVARRGGGPVGARAPPSAGLRADEALYVPTVAEVVAQLHRDGLSRSRAADLAARLVEFSWYDAATGTGVIVVPTHRLAELRRLDLLRAAVEHAPEVPHRSRACRVGAADGRACPRPRRRPGPARARRAADRAARPAHGRDRRGERPDGPGRLRGQDLPRRARAAARAVRPVRARREPQGRAGRGPGGAVPACPERGARARTTSPTPRCTPSVAGGCRQQWR